MKDFIEIEKDKQIYIPLIERALYFKSSKNNPNYKDSKLLLAFFENSTRTKLSFDIAAANLSVRTIDLNPSTSSIAKGESLLDTMLTIGNMGVDIFAIRHSQVGICKYLSQNLPYSFINCGEGAGQHPSQALLDIITLIEHFKELSGKKITFVGDINNSRVAGSTVQLCRLFGIEIYFLPSAEIDSDKFDFDIIEFSSIREAIAYSDILYFLRYQSERSGNQSLEEYKENIGLRTDDISKYDDVVVMHPGPVNYSYELERDILLRSNTLINKQVENGVYARMSILEKLILEKRK